MEVAGMTPKERATYEKNLDDVRVEQALMREYKARGLEEGRAEGRELGRAEGKELGIAEGKELGIAEGKELGIAEGKELGIAEGRALEREELVRRMKEQGLDQDVIAGIIGR